MLYVAMGCFWGAERIFWQLPGVVTTAAGYMGGLTPNATYEEVCSGRTGHTEAVLVAYDPAVTSAETLLAAFWENHDPTQGFRQGNDVGSQYRSAIYWTTPEQEQAAPGHPRGVPGRPARPRLRRDHHRAAARAGGRRVLLRRGLPPAVPPQEPRRLLQPRPQRDDLPGRPRAAERAAQPDLGAAAGQRAGRLTCCRGLGLAAGRSTQSVPTWRGEPPLPR